MGRHRGWIEGSSTSSHHLQWILLQLRTLTFVPIFFKGYKISQYTKFTSILIYFEFLHHEVLPDFLFVYFFQR